MLRLQHFKRRDFPVFGQVTNICVSVNKAGTEAQVRIPCFVAEDFDRTGNISIWRLQRLLTTARIYVYHTTHPETGRTFLEYDKLTKDKFTFMASSHTHVDRTFYQLPDKDTLPSLAVKVHLGYIGGASLNSVAQLVDESSGFLFASNTNQVVLVDKVTRKPALLPLWWKEQYQDHVVGNKKLVVDTIKPPAKDTGHLYNMKVSWNDIDTYKHTNYISYVRFCFDAAMDALSTGYFSKIRDELLLYPVKSMDIAYKGESLAGQELVVHCWENVQDPFIVHFDISREGETIFQNTIQFYAPEVTL